MIKANKLWHYTLKQPLFMLYNVQETNINQT